MKKELPFGFGNAYIAEQQRTVNVRLRQDTAVLLVRWAKSAQSKKNMKSKLIVTYKDLLNYDPIIFEEKESKSNSERTQKITETAAMLFHQKLFEDSIKIPKLVNYGKTHFSVDFYLRNNNKYVEVTSALFKLKGAKKHKVTRDTLKLILINKIFPESNCEIAVFDEKIKKELNGDSWLSYTLREYGIYIRLIKIDNKLKSILEKDKVGQDITREEK